MRLRLPAALCAAALAACVDAEPLSPEIEQSLFSVLGGLRVGEALTVRGETAFSIVLPGGADGARYVFIPFLAAEEGAVRLRLRVSGESLASLDGSERLSSPAPPEPRSSEGPVRDDHAHMRLREWERQNASRLFAASRPALGRGVDAQRVVDERETVTVLAPGDIVPLRVINRAPENRDLCSNPLERTGRVTAVTDHAVLIEDVRNPVALSAEDIDRIAEEYDRLVHPVAVDNFGEPTDIDGNGRVIIFMTAAVNEVASRAGGGITVGFTFAPDLLPRTWPDGQAGCAASNEGEIFYLIAPDPAATLGVRVPEAAVRRLSSAIIVHELQHMINAGRRLYLVPDAREFEELWLNEGLSHIAEELVFYAATGLQPGRDLGWSVIRHSEATLDAYERFVRDNMSIYATYLGSPDEESLMGKSERDDDFTTRGAAWAFLRYLADQTPTEDAALFRALVNSPVAGVQNLRRVLDTDPLTWMQRWTVANYAENRPEEERVEVLYTQPSWDFSSIFEEEMGYLPLAPRMLEPDDAMTVTLHGGGSSFVVLRASPGRHARLNSVRSGMPVFGEFRASVMRIE